MRITVCLHCCTGITSGNMNWTLTPLLPPFPLQKSSIFQDPSITRSPIWHFWERLVVLRLKRVYSALKHFDKRRHPSSYGVPTSASTKVTHKKCQMPLCKRHRDNPHCHRERQDLRLFQGLTERPLLSSPHGCTYRPFDFVTSSRTLCKDTRSLD